MLVCQITDLHVRLPGELSRRVVDCAALLEQCVDAILRLPQQPDVVVATGDLVDGGRVDEYAHVRQLLAPLSMPVYLTPGNRDERAALRSAFSDHGYLHQWQPFIQYVIDDWPLRIVALDTVVPTESGGRLCAERLAWLERTLASERDKPTLLIMHHPPFPTFIGRMNQHGFDGSESLAAIVARNPQIERVLCGHIHRSVTFRFAGTIASICPSTAHQTTLNLASDAVPTFMLEPPGFQLHAWKQGVGVVSHTACIGDYAGPYPFR
jgi:3',5'-cyclic-AMP phosphodiesterase